MTSRDAEVAAVAEQINQLLDDLTETVAALNKALASSTPTTGTEDEPHEHRRQ